HRCEFVAEIGGVTYINDSKATNVDAVEKALRSLTGPVVLIAGGRDKGLDFTQLKEVVREKVKLAVVIGETQDALCKAWARSTMCVRAGSMRQAVKMTASGARTYVVRKGDSLWKIAKSQSVSIGDLARANSLTKTSALKVGQKLQVPSVAKAEPATTATASVIPTATDATAPTAAAAPVSGE